MVVYLLSMALEELTIPSLGTGSIEVQEHGCFVDSDGCRGVIVKMADFLPDTSLNLIPLREGHMTYCQLWPIC